MGDQDGNLVSIVSGSDVFVSGCDTRKFSVVATGVVIGPSLATLFGKDQVDIHSNAGEGYN